jgi:hypothetical protein
MVVGEIKKQVYMNKNYISKTNVKNDKKTISPKTNVKNLLKGEKKTRCPKGSRRNKKTGLCEKKTITQKCSKGRQLNKLTDMCENNPIAILSNNIELCLEDKWLLIKKLGKGKEGTVYEVKKKTGGLFAMKVFKKYKSKKKFKNEIDFQIKAGNLAPEVICYSYEPTPRFIMEKMAMTLPELIKSQDGKLTPKQQNEILNLHKNMDTKKILHKDPNPLNIMIDKKGDFKFIDFGFSQKLKKNESNLYSLEALIYSVFRGIHKYVKLKDISILVEEVNRLKI